SPLYLPASPGVHEHLKISPLEGQIVFEIATCKKEQTALVAIHEDRALAPHLIEPRINGLAALNDAQGALGAPENVASDLACSPVAIGKPPLAVAYQDVVCSLSEREDRIRLLGRLLRGSRSRSRS